MSDRAAQASANERSEQLAVALGRWSADPSLATLAASSGAILLVLDQDGERVLHASEEGASLRSAIADADGRLRAATGLTDQIRRLGALSERPRLARLRFDGRGIAPPTTCRVARAPFGDGSSAVLVALAGPPPAMRFPADRPKAAAVAQKAPNPQPAEADPPAQTESPVSNRLVWRSDAEGVLTLVSGGRTDLAAALWGRTWDEVCSDSSDGGRDALVSALRERRTFRSVGVTVRLGTDAVDLDMSGAPSGRAGTPFAGFGGFAVIRPRRPSREIEASDGPEAPAVVDGVPASDLPSISAEATEPTPPHEDPPDVPQAAVRLPASWGRSSPFAAILGAGAGAVLGLGLSGREPTSDQASPARSTPEPGAAVPPSPAGEPAPDLSVDEQAAFREIARALGARFPEDPADKGHAEPTPISKDDPHGTVTPFPVAASAQAGIGEAVSAVLEGLPAGVLVHRAGTVLFANRRLFDLTGFADLPAVQGADGLERLLDGPHDRQDAPVSFATGNGETARLQVERGTLDWAGEPAELLLARMASDPVPEILADECSAEPAHGVQAGLDRPEDGVVTLDAGGHVLMPDCSAAAILAGGGREAVGKRLVTLFGPDGTAAMDARPRPAQEASEAAGRPGAVPLRARIARLLAVDETPPDATLQDLAPTKRTEDDAASARKTEEAGRRKLAFFAEAGQKIRAPLNGILSVAEAMLDEQFGPLGSERYRDYLHDIQASGGEALGLLDDLVDLARVESGRLDLSFSDLRLNDLVSGCIAEMQPEAARERIVVRTSLSPDLATLSADARSMRQAARNAIAQAIRHSEPGGQVIVSTTLAEGGEVALRVRDTGAGMSADEIEHALEPFRQASLPGSAKPGGDGLGLTLTKALVEANRGRFRITSRTGEGTLVEMVFPPPQAIPA